MKKLIVILLILSSLIAFLGAFLKLENASPTLVNTLLIIGLSGTLLSIFLVLRQYVWVKN